TRGELHFLRREGKIRPWHCVLWVEDSQGNHRKEEACRTRGTTRGFAKTRRLPRATTSKATGCRQIASRLTASRQIASRLTGSPPTSPTSRRTGCPQTECPPTASRQTASRQTASRQTERLEAEGSF